MIVNRLTTSREGMKKRVAAYCRVSTPYPEQEKSFETQVRYYQEMIGANPDWELVDIFADQGFSGTSARKRPDFNRMLRSARAGKLDIVFVKSISRFSRNVVECRRFVEELKERGVEVRFEKEGVSSFDPASDFMFSAYAIFVQSESRSISDNVKWVLQQRFSVGDYCIGSNRMLGYDTAPETKKLTPNEDAWVVRRVFRRFIEGATYQAIADELNAMNVQCMTRKRHPRSKAQFSCSTIRRILINETYVGDKLLQKNPPIDLLTKRPDWTVDYNSWYVENDHERIVDRETWEKAQAILEGRRSDAAQGIHRRSPEHHVFFGRVFCAACGSPYKRRTFSIIQKSSDGTTVRCHYHAWNCKERQKGKNGNGCKGITLQEGTLQSLIASQMDWDTFSEERFIAEVARVEVSDSGIRIQRKAA